MPIHAIQAARSEHFNSLDSHTYNLDKPPILSNKAALELVKQVKNQKPFIKMKKAQKSSKAENNPLVARILIKRLAKGDKSIPEASRLYFKVHLKNISDSVSIDPIHVFVSMNSIIGKALDTWALLFGLKDASNMAIFPQGSDLPLTRSATFSAEIKNCQSLANFGDIFITSEVVPYLQMRLSKHLADSEQASSEFRWLAQHVKTIFNPQNILSRPKIHSNFTQTKSNFRNHILYSKQLNWLGQAIKQRTLFAKPLQYILGTQPFNNLEILVAKPTLIPRWETEEWSTKLANVIVHNIKSRLLDSNPPPHKPFRILDLCTGSGCIALNLAQVLSENNISIEITGIDISNKAIKLANRNKFYNLERFKTPHVASNITFLCMDIYSLLSKKPNSVLENEYDLIVSNPPYISTSDYFTQLDKDVKNWEDIRALVPNVQHRSLSINPHGISNKFSTPSTEGLEMLMFLLKLYEYMISTKKISNPISFLSVPKLVLEIGDSIQAQKLCEAAKKSEILRSHKIEIWHDLANKPRTVVLY
ncbi:hypothetical protein BB561_002479 [Smittium simulii]|uniref:Methyltransferase domain-containing protein n=1 Tax=Smittium simulii TaxID=133385 RepID=A0A2T9YQH0_9FUNG|nr:hypothetical protein BB561_002479 [Smittium simulii]